MVAQIIRNQIEKIEYREKKIFWALFSVFVFFLISYGVLVNKTIMNAVAQQSVEQNLATLNSNVNTLDFQYLGLANSITMDTAATLGFVALSGAASEKFAVIETPQTDDVAVNEN